MNFVGKQVNHPAEPNQVLDVSGLKVGCFYELVSYLHSGSSRSSVRERVELLEIGPTKGVKNGFIRVQSELAKKTINRSLTDLGVIAYEDGNWNPSYCLVLCKD